MSFEEQAPSSAVPVINDASAIPTLKRVLRWYFERVYGHSEGPGLLPFYCDPKRVGAFAVSPDELAVGSPPALFKLFVAMAMFQARRDVVIMRQQAAMATSAVQSLASVSAIRRLASQSACEQLESAASFDAGCSVYKRGAVVDCSHHPGSPCHVKDATVLLKRMGDMGKLPTSAWLHAWKDGRLPRLLAAVKGCEASPQKRAELMVERLSEIHRVG